MDYIQHAVYFINIIKLISLWFTLRHFQNLDYIVACRPIVTQQERWADVPGPFLGNVSVNIPTTTDTQQ
jgi:hypothetical protein